MGVEKNRRPLIPLSRARWSADHILDFVRPNHEEMLRREYITHETWIHTLFCVVCLGFDELWVLKSIVEPNGLSISAQTMRLTIMLNRLRIFPLTPSSFSKAIQELWPLHWALVHENMIPLDYAFWRKYLFFSLKHIVPDRLSLKAA